MRRRQMFAAIAKTPQNDKPQSNIARQMVTVVPAKAEAPAKRKPGRPRKVK